MEINCEITRKDHYKFFKYHQIHVNKVRNILFYFVFPIFMSILANLIYIDDLSKFINGTLLLLTTLIPIMIIVLMIMFLLYRFGPSKNGNMLGKIKYIINEDGFRFIGENIECLTKWPGIKFLKENRKYYFLYLDTAQAYVIPKRAFKSEEEKIELDSILNEYLSLEKEK